jgi:hypothetical protein
VFGFERWEHWLNERARVFREAGQVAELRSSGGRTPKPGCSFRLQTNRALGPFDVWLTGEADFDVMDAQSEEFTHHVWGMIVDDLSFEAAFDDFLTRVMQHPTRGRGVPDSMRSAWFHSESKL